MQIPEKDIVFQEYLEGEWRLVVYMNDSKRCVRIFNPTEAGEEKYFAIDTASNKYGAPMLEKEPSLRIPVIVKGISYEIAGIVVLGENGEIKDRFSLSNLKFSRQQNLELKECENGYELFINEQSQGFLNTISNIDKNRVIGEDAIFTYKAPMEILYYELETLLQRVANENQ